MTALVTIGLPCYNSAKYVELTILSILNQTYTNWRLIIIDDNSSDNTREVLQRFLVDERITLKYDGENLGLSRRLNQMVEICETKYFARMDSDDIMDVLRLEKQVDYLEKEASIDVLGTFVYSINGENAIMGKRGDLVPTTLLQALKRCVFVHPTVLGRTEWFKRNKYDTDCNRMEDYELWFRTFAKSRFHVLPDPLLFYREVDVNNRKKYWSSKINAYKIVRNTNDISITVKVFFVLSEYLKGLVYTIFSILGQEKRLLRKRVSQIDEMEMKLLHDRLRVSIRKSL
jgi:glycosyltransferase involved in cell wall biosynthesis